MSDDPTQRILAAIDGLGARIGGLEGRMEGLEGRMEGLEGRMEGLEGRMEGLAGRMEGLAGRIGRLEAGQADFSARQDRMRIDLMGRMDRLQDTQTEQRDSMDVLLDLLVNNQRMAERSLSEARLGVDMQSRITTTIAALERQVRRLQDDVRHLKGES